MVRGDGIEDMLKGVSLPHRQHRNAKPACLNSPFSTVSILGVGNWSVYMAKSVSSWLVLEPLLLRKDDF